MRWEQGRAAIERMLADGELQRVPASREHLAVLEAVRAQLDPPMGRVLRQFNRMRTRRHDAEYPPTDSPEITPADVREDQATAESLIDIATRLLDEMSPF
jgi:hypothetical protein